MRGRATRRVFGVRTWLVVFCLAAALRYQLADPLVRAEIERGMRLARQPFTVEFDPAVRAATEAGVTVCPAHGGWFEFGCMGICDKAPRGVTSCPIPGGAS